MLVSMGNSADSAAVILPEVSDSTIASVQGNQRASQRARFLISLEERERPSLEGGNRDSSR